MCLFQHGSFLEIKILGMNKLWIGVDSPVQFIEWPKTFRAVQDISGWKDGSGKSYPQIFIFLCNCLPFKKAFCDSV